MGWGGRETNQRKNSSWNSRHRSTCSSNTEKVQIYKSSTQSASAEVVQEQEAPRMTIKNKHSSTWKKLKCRKFKCSQRDIEYCLLGKEITA